MPRPGPRDRQKIALSHYVAIAPRIEHEVPPGERMALWRQLAIEHGVTVRTLQRWHQTFLKEGLDGLAPAEHRSDRGQLRALPETLLDAAVQLRREQPERGSSALILLLEARSALCPQMRLGRHRCRVGAQC